MFSHLQHIPATSEEDFVERGTEVLKRGIQDAITKRGWCVLGLSGGSTPREIYTRLGSSKDIDFSLVKIFLVDERYVPSDHKESNQHLLQETLLVHAKIPVENLVFPDTALGIDACVREYEERMQELLRDAGPDIVVLGLGEDGHIASLFPGDVDALLETERLVLHTHIKSSSEGAGLVGPAPVGHHSRKGGLAGGKPGVSLPRIADRITVTFPVLTRAHVPLFLLKGEGKKKIFAETLSANTDPIEYPAHALLETGRSLWVTYW